MEPPFDQGGRVAFTVLVLLGVSAVARSVPFPPPIARRWSPARSWSPGARVTSGIALSAIVFGAAHLPKWSGDDGRRIVARGDALPGERNRRRGLRVLEPIVVRG